ncbi:centrosome-associated 350 isoform X1 [Paramuricea clavata]|uniref:Centrosome-associated 350 isoform X1 n=1 Tax=Paramuricea clavata TaxID=317549 RepID=A0A7D9DG71_PARCT|nr:centrosome-associated 350 isoform X1 [Paramuricea clavata]
MKEVLSKETQSMLIDLAQDSSESDSEVQKDLKDEKAKCSPSKKKMLKNKKPAAIQKPIEDIFPKGKTRHYDQAEVQKYMAQQLAERKKKQKQEKIQKKKQEEEKQQRLKELYERQKKSFAPTKKDKRLGKTFSFGNFDVHVPGEDFHPENNQGYTKDDQVIQNTNDNESDKENTDIDEMSSERYTDDADVTLTEDILTSSRETPRRHIPAEPAPALDQRAQRLTALQATALALQSRLQSHALRLSGAKEGAVPQPAASAQPMETDFGFQGVLPGVANIRKHADENEKQSTRVAAATKIQAAYRGHTVRKRRHWTDEKMTSERSGNTAPALTSDRNARDMLSEHVMKPTSFPSASHGTRMDMEPSLSEASSDDVQFTNIRPFYKTERLNNDLQRLAPKVERKFQYDDLRTRSNFLRNDFSAPSVTHFTASPVRYEPRGDRFSVMNIFSRRHPTLPVEDILNEEPGSDTASLLEVDRRKSPDMEYEDDFTDAEISSVMTDGDVKKDASKAETYSECFETDEDTDTKRSKTKQKSKASHSSLERKKNEQRTSQAESEERQLSERDERSKTSPLSEDDNMSSPNQQDDFILPVMASTMQPETRRSPSISPLEENEPIRRRPYIPKPVDRSGGDRLSPDSLQRKLTAEINLLENVEDSVRQVSDIERTRAISLAQQETVSLAQILKAKQQTHEQDMRNLRLKAKEEAIQAAKDLEKTRQAAAVAAASAAERLAEVQTEAIKTNTEHSRKYMEEATRMTSGLLANTSNHLAEFCKNLTSTTSAAIGDLHKTKRPTMTLVERATSISEGHAINYEHSSTSDERTRTSDEGTRTSDVLSNQSKSLNSSPSVKSPRQQAGYSSDEFESYQSQTARHDGSDMKAEITDHPSLSPESIAEDIPEKSISEDTTIHEDDTTVHDESGNDARDVLPREPRSKGHDSVSSVLDYSSQFDDSSHALTDEDINFSFLLPSREHRRKGIRRMKDISFDEDKRKEKSVRTPFESDDSFGKFTADMIQQYVHEEEVRTKHQAAILRLREKSLKEKTKAELQWVERMKKQSRDKGSDDVMPSIKKRERGIRMKLKAEKEEIKCLRAANRAASFQRRFMIYQQQEIQRLNKATLNIRERIQKDTSKKGSERSSREPSQSHPRTSSPVAKPNSQSTPSSSSKSKTNQSASAKSVSEDISGQQGLSPNTTGSSFPSYATPKSEDGNQEQPSTTARGEQQPETSTILNMLSGVDVGGQGSSSQSGDLLKIHKMLLERQEKLVKDETEVNTALQKVTEMLKNQRNLSNQLGTAISEASQSKRSIAEASQSESRVSDASHSKQSKASGKSPSERSVPEEISSTARSVSEEAAKGESAADKTANDYDNATFESDDSTPRSRRSVTSQHLTSQNGEVNVEDELFSLTETSDQSDVEERVRKLNEVLVREKKKFEALERKKRKIKRSVMKKEAIKLEIEIKNTRDDIHRKMVEIKTASAAAQSPTPTKISPHQDVVLSPRENRGKSSRRSSDHTPLVSDKQDESERGIDMDRGVGSSTHEVEESLIEVLDDSPKSTDVLSGTKRPRLSETSPVRTGSETSDIPDELHSNEKEESMVEIIDKVHIPTPRGRKGVFPDMDRGVRPENERIDHQSTKSTSEPASPPIPAKDDSSDIPEEISEHSRSTASIPEQVPSVGEDETSKISEIPEELSEKLYTPIPSDASVSEEDSRIVEGTHSKAISSPEESPRSTKYTISKTPSYSYGDETFENSYTEPKSSTGVSEKSPSIQKISEDPPNQKSRSISEHLTGPAEEIPSISEHLTGPVGRSARVSDEASYNEPESDTSVSNHSSVSRRRQEQSKSEANKSRNRRKRSDASDISKSLFSDDEISQKSMTSSRRSRARTEDEKSESDRQTKPSPTVPATKSDEEKSSASEQRKSPESVKTPSKVSPRSPQDSVPNDNGSRSEASSIAEEIASGYEEGDISESGGVLREQQSEELIFGDNVKHERMRANESGLDKLSGTGLDQSGLDKSGLKELDRTELDDIGVSKPGLSEPKKSVSELDESGLDKPGLKEPKMDESRIKQSGDYTEVSRETAADISPLKQSDESSKSLRSQSSRSRGVGRNEQPKESGDEQQYSDDFDDASIAEEISEIGEFSEIAEDSDKGENFAIFSSNHKTVEGGAESTQGTAYESREHKSESHGKHVGDDITNYIYTKIIADSLTSVKNLNASKLQSADQTTSDQNDLTRKRVDNEGPLDTNEVISEHDITQGSEHTGIPGVPTGRLDTNNTASLDTRRETAQSDTRDRVTSGQTATERSEEGHLATNSITKDLLADAIMQMIEIQQRKKKNIKLPAAVETKPSETESSRTAPVLSPPAEETVPEKIPDTTIPTGTTSPVSIPEIESPADDETTIDNALMIAKTNQILDDDALRSIDDDIAGLLGTVDDEDEFPVNITNFSSDIPSDNEVSFPEYSPMFAVPHSTQELTPMVNSTIDVLLEQRRLGRPLEDCLPRAQFLAGEAENELECASTQSYRHLAFDLTKEVFIDTLSQNEPAARPPWAKAKWKGGQKLSRHFKRWKSDEEIRAAVMERVTNVIGLGAPRATMATIPRKTPVRGNKKDNVDAILIEELRQEEPLWTDYEEDETNVKFQVADAILNMMLEDTARVFNAIQAKKHVPDNVLVV